MSRDNKISHYIIDRRKRQEYLFIFFVFITISFGTGYTFGYLHGIPAEAEEITTNNQEITPLTTSKSLSAKTTKPEDKSLHNSLAKKETKPSNSQHIESKKVNTNTVQVAKLVKPKPPSPTSIGHVNPPKENAKSKTAVIKSTPQIKASKVERSQSKIASKSSTTKSGKKVKESAKSTDNNPVQYLVQVGLFASRENASSFIDQLEESGFEGYFEGFISTSGVEKYNVRLGPFNNKSAAQAKMAAFQKTHNSSAYILTHK